MGWLVAQRIFDRVVEAIFEPKKIDKKEVILLLLKIWRTAIHPLGFAEIL